MKKRGSFDDEIIVAKFCMRCAGILPLFEGRSRTKKLLNDGVIIVYFIFAFCVLIPMIRFIVDNLKSDFEETLTVGVPFIYGIGAVGRLFLTYLNRAKTERLLRFCRSSWNRANDTDFRIILAWTKRAKFVTILYCILAQGTAVLYNWSPIVAKIWSKSNVTSRKLPFPAIIDSTESPLYELLYTFQFVSSHMCTVTVSACDMIVILVTFVLCGELQVLRSRLTNLDNEMEIRTSLGNHRSPRSNLSKFIDEHQIIMKWCIELERAVSNISLIQIVFGMYMMTFSMTTLLTGHGMFRHAGTLMISLTGMFFSCWSGDILIVESTKIAEALYALPWYRFTPPMKKTLAIALMKSQRPAKLTAGKFVTLAIPTFSSVISEGLSLFMVLSRI